MEFYTVACTTRIPRFHGKGVRKSWRIGVVGAGNLVVGASRSPTVILHCLNASTRKLQCRDRCNYRDNRLNINKTAMDGIFKTAAAHKNIYQVIVANFIVSRERNSF